MTTLAEEGAALALSSQVRAAGLAQMAAGFVLGLGTLTAGALLVALGPQAQSVDNAAAIGAGRVVLGTVAGTVPLASGLSAGTVTLGRPAAAVPLAPEIGGGGLRLVPRGGAVGCASGVAAMAVTVGHPLQAVGVGARVEVGYLWRVGRLQTAPGELSAVSPGIAGGDLQPSIRGIALPISAPAYVPLSETGGGADTAINLPAYWLAVPLPAAYLGEIMAAVAIARGEPVVCSLGLGTTIGGRTLLNNTGTKRLYSTLAGFEAWQAKALAELASQVGGLAVRGNDAAARSAWVKATRAANASKAQTVLRQAGRLTDDAKRAALVADAEFLLARV